MAMVPDLREKMGAAAVKVARAAGYVNAGTIEFLVDRDANFYFLEMNTRLQVEHPVTELVTGLDLVEWQLRIAAGEKLTIRQEDVRWQGSAMECRIYAEDPEQNYLPFPGKITKLVEPSGPGIRLDSGVYEGWTVPMEYDPLLAKLAAWSPTREGVIQKLDRALAEYALAGIRTNIAFFRQILANDNFQAGRLSTAFLSEWSMKPESLTLDQQACAALVAALTVPKAAPVSTQPVSRWLSQGREGALR
jgi:acetyl-CoA carboxylase biotin carboxylase subunit